MRVLPVHVFYEEKRSVYDLELLTESAASAHPISVREINRPGMCLTGFVGNFLHDRIQILGETELHYLHEHEWARGADDVLWRRSKLGLHYDDAARSRVVHWWENHFGEAAQEVANESAGG